MSESILLIEDEPAIADTLSYALESEGFRCTWAATGSRGLAEIEKGDVDLILLDVGLPDMNGFELCKALRKTLSIPIIFLTARSGEIDRVVGLEIGADDYVVKPFSPREVTARVKAVLRRFYAAKPKVASPGESAFTIDEARHQISYQSQPLATSRYEFRLLKILIDRPGWVFTREKLMALAWDAPESSMDRTVDAHIKSIRAKLRNITPDIDPIQTHRGVGYSLKEDL